MPRPRAVKRASNLPRVGALLVVLLTMLLAAPLGACGTILNIAPDEPSDGGGNGEGSTTLDDSGSFVDFDAGDASTACGLSVDTKAIALGEIITGAAPITRQVNITSLVDSPTMVTLVVAGGGFTSPTSSPLAVPANAPTVPFDVTFTPGATGAQVGAATLTWAGGCTITIPLSANVLATGSIAVSPATLDLGSVPCGQTPPPGAIHVQSSTATSWTASLTPGPFAMPDAGTLTPPTTDIAVTSGPLVPMVDPKSFDSDITLQIADAGTRTIHVTALSLGGKLAFQPNDITLTKETPSRTIALMNTGTQAVRVSLTIAPPFTISTGSSKVIVPTGGLATARPVTISSTTAGNATAVQLAKVTVDTGTLCFTGTLTVRQ